MGEQVLGGQRQLQRDAEVGIARVVDPPELAAQPGPAEPELLMPGRFAERCHVVHQLADVERGPRPDETAGPQPVQHPVGVPVEQRADQPAEGVRHAGQLQR